MHQKIVCFGETLWDILPSGKMPGGAPMNVAIHLHHNSFNPAILSRVGNDDLGKELLEYLQRQGINTEWIQKGETHLTGVVKANITDRSEVTYKIVEPVAWDYIQYEERIGQLVANCDVFLYGSLVGRGAVSLETLLKYLPLAKRKIFDVNLRPPHYTPELVQRLMKLANIVKMNHQELAEICGWLGVDGDFPAQMKYLFDGYGLELVIVTRAEKGAAVYANGVYFEHGGYQVEVEDTIGSGDAFLATFLTNYLQQKSLEYCLERACLIGAYVATQRGATPFYKPEEITYQALHKEQSTIKS